MIREINQLPNTSPEYVSDSELIQQTLSGNRIAFHRLEERHRPYILNLARRALGDRDDAQDVTQETLVYAYQRLSQVRNRNLFAAWLRALTLSLCVDYRRRRGTRRLGEPITARNETTEERDYTETLTIQQALSHLSEDHQTAVLLHYVGGWSLTEVAALTDRPVNTVRSRLMAAKAQLRTSLQGFRPEPVRRKGKRIMPVDTLSLSESSLSMIASAFPGARVVSLQNDPEPWMPFGPRIRLLLKNGGEKDVDIRSNIDPTRAELLPVLERLGIPGPRLIHKPIANGTVWHSLCELPRGDNLTLWTLGGTAHRVRLATERTFEGIDRLEGITSALEADPIGAKLERRTLLDEVGILTDDDRWNRYPWLAEGGVERRQWLVDPWFSAALTRVKAAVADIDAALVYTDYLRFFTQNYRIAPSIESTKFPDIEFGNPASGGNPLVEFMNAFGHFGDPLLGLAVVWVYDCYPFVHTGFVEQFLWRRGVTKREFAPRLGLKALQMIARDLPVVRPVEGGDYWDRLRGWAEQALSWL